MTHRELKDDFDREDGHGNTISACISVRNEENHIRRCLESIDGVVDEIVVVHGGPCSDRTLDICREYTDEIYVRPKRGLPEPDLPFAFEQASGEWILKIDADERLSEPLREDIRDIVDEAEADLFSFVWPHTNGDEQLSDTIEHPYRPCLARKSKLSYIGFPHEPLQTDGTIEKRSYELVHQPGYNKFTLDNFRTELLPLARKHATWLHKDPSEIPLFNISESEVKEHVRESGRPTNLFRRAVIVAAWHMYNGMWRLGRAGFRITLVESAYFLAVLYYTLVYDLSESPAQSS